MVHHRHISQKGQQSMRIMCYTNHFMKPRFCIILPSFCSHDKMNCFAPLIREILKKKEVTLLRNCHIPY